MTSLSGCTLCTKPATSWHNSRNLYLCLVGMNITHQRSNLQSKATTNPDADHV